MPVSEERLRKRLEIRVSQVEDKDVILAKLRDKIRKGYVPKDPKEFADILRIVSEYQQLVGKMEECKEIIEKLGGSPPKEIPMTMEKYGVECNNQHEANSPYMEKTASGEQVECKYCGLKLDLVKVADEIAAQDGFDLTRKPEKKPEPRKPDKGQSTESMFGA